MFCSLINLITMARTSHFLVLFFFHVAFVEIRGQEDYCIPQQVQNIVLSDDFLLSWSPSPTEGCTIQHYLIYLNTLSIWEEQVFQVEETVLNVGHVPECDGVSFRIIAVSTDNVEGRRVDYYTKTAAPPDVNLNLTYFRLFPTERGVRLEWDVADEWRRCLKEYRVLCYNEDEDRVFLTMYMLFPYTDILNMVPCSSYVFTVTALHSLETEGHVSVIRYVMPSAKISAPQPQRIIPGSTTVDLTWILPGPDVNRCPVNSLVVDGSPYFNISYPISGQNQVNRPPQNVHLTGLQPDTLYILKVSANNTSGPSEPFIVAVQTLE